MCCYLCLSAQVSVVCFRVGEMYAVAHANSSAASTPISKGSASHLPRTEHHNPPRMLSLAKDNNNSTESNVTRVAFSSSKNVPTAFGD